MCGRLGNLETLRAVASWSLEILLGDWENQLKEGCGGSIHVNACFLQLAAPPLDRLV